MKIYVIGDSISVQYGRYLETYLEGLMEYSRKKGEDEALLDLDKPSGANGGDSGMVRSFLEACAKADGIDSDLLDADLLLVNCGLHDIKTDPQTGERQVGIDEYEENLEAIIEISACLGVGLIWIRTTPCDETVHNRGKIEFHRFAADCIEYNGVADRIMSEAGVPMIDLFSFTGRLGDDVYCDHVHFHEHIREKQAAYIAGWLSAYAQLTPLRCEHHRPHDNRSCARVYGRAYDTG